MDQQAGQSELPNAGEQGDTDDDADADQLKNRVETLEQQHEEMQQKYLDAQSETTKLQQKANRLEQENQKLKQSPTFVATVKELTSSGVLVKQHGNNQEAVTEVTDERREDLEPGDRVTINNNLSITGKLERGLDSRAQAMQVDHSPEATYDDIGGIEDQIEGVRETVEMPLESPDVFDSVGIDPPSGVLLHGPPGTGKTMLAKAVANQTDATFISMAGSELVQKFIGEGSKMVRDLFEVARENEPAVIFIDEIDAIASQRTDSKTSGESEVQRTMMQLLSELDGFDDRGDVMIIAATNRFDMLDEALLRPGRFDRLVEVPKPDVEAREEIFQIHTEEMNLEDDIDFEGLAEMTTDASGADIRSICTEAGMFAIRDGREVVSESDFFQAREEVLEDEEENHAEATHPSSPAFA